MPQKILAAFDFDHTLITENSDIYVQKLAPGGKIPPEIQSVYSDRGWTKYMGCVFEHLHKHGVTPEQILDCMREIPLVDGMKELLQWLVNSGHQVIVISDSNSLFIKTILKAQQVDHLVHSVYTNPAEFNSEGCLTIRKYHEQDWCNLCTCNLCKGHILQTHIKSQKDQGLSFAGRTFAGDGGNDVCPCLKLEAGDLAFARKGYRLIKKIKQVDGLVARLIEWDNGYDISKVLLDYDS